MNKFPCQREKPLKPVVSNDNDAAVVFSQEHDPIVGNKFQDIEDITEYLDVQDLSIGDIENLAQSKNNIALIKELCNHPEMATQKGLYTEFNGRYGYTGTYGYCGTHHPTYLTLDLGRNVNIGVIMFLLWDDLKDWNHGQEERRYFYRLLVAEDSSDKQSYETDRDSIKWTVLYDSEHSGYRNWQIFRIVNEGGIRARYIRIHCVYNPKNNGFNVVRIRVYGPVVSKHLDTTKLYNALHENIVYERKKGRDKYCEDSTGKRLTYEVARDPSGLSQIIEVHLTNETPIEIGDGAPLSKRIYDVSNVMHRVETKNLFTSFDVEKESLDGINQIVRGTLRESEYDRTKYRIDTQEDVENIIRSIACDIEIIEKNSDGIERIIINPVNLNLRNSEWVNVGIIFLSWVITGIPLVNMFLTGSVWAQYVAVIFIFIGFWCIWFCVKKVRVSNNKGDGCKQNKEGNIGMCQLCYEGKRSECTYYNRNLALSKPVLGERCPLSEDTADMRKYLIDCKYDTCNACINPVQLTDGNASGFDGIDYAKGYSEFSGFCGVIYPGYITVDLEKEQDVSTIQFLLWDNRGNDKKEASKSRYHYRLLYAKDSSDASKAPIEWFVAYDMIRGVEPGWQVFHFKKPVRMRYIRIHAISTTSKGWHIFRVVQLEAYRYPLVGYKYNYLPSFVWTIKNDDSRIKTDKRVGDYYKLTGFFDIIIKKIEDRREKDKEDNHCALTLGMLSAELQQIRHELQQHESYINFQIGNLLGRTDHYLKNGNIIIYISLSLTAISLLLCFI